MPLVLKAAVNDGHFENSGQIADKMVFKQKNISANADFTDFAEMIMVPLTGLEPVRCFQQGILSPSCLPISPQRHNHILYNYTIFKRKCQAKSSCCNKNCYSTAIKIEQKIKNTEKGENLME